MSGFAKRSSSVRLPGAVPAVLPEKPIPLFLQLIEFVNADLSEFVFLFRFFQRFFQFFFCPGSGRFFFRLFLRQDFSLCFRFSEFDEKGAVDLSRPAAGTEKEIFKSCPCGCRPLPRTGFYGKKKFFSLGARSVSTGRSIQWSFSCLLMTVAPLLKFPRGAVRQTRDS